jgi:hypothetical protein
VIASPISHNRSRSRQPSKATLLGALLTVVVITTACGSGATGSTGTPTTGASSTTPAIATSSPPGSSPSSSPAAGGDLAGTWTGQYSGDFQGTFTLTWTESGSKLQGTIDLSSLGGSVPINGTVNGNDISFGTVGSTAITYTGSVSGDSMSGQYQVEGQGGGSWSASKTA